MTLSEMGALLATTNLPVAYESFKEQVNLPAIVYNSPRTHNFSADDIVYKLINRVVIELYTQYRDLDTEETIEAVLQDFFWDKTVVYLDTEKCYQIIYEIEV